MGMITPLFTVFLQLPVLRQLHLKQHLFTGRGKNALKKRFLQKTQAIINAELELLNFKITHPESFPLVTPLTFESSLSVIPKFPNLGIMGMTEILSALMLLGGITDNIGKNPTIIAFSEVFEQAFGFSFDRLFKTHSNDLMNN